MFREEFIVKINNLFKILGFNLRSTRSLPISARRECGKIPESVVLPTHFAFQLCESG